MNTGKCKNPFTKCREHAIKTAHTKGGSVMDCFYPKNPYKSVWLKVFETESQVDWVSNL